MRAEKSQPSLGGAHIAAVVDEARQVAIVRGDDDVVVVDAEEVAAAHAGRLVTALPLVCHGLPHHLPHVLNHHLVRSYCLHRKQPPVVNGGLELASCRPEEGECEGVRGAPQLSSHH